MSGNSDNFENTCVVCFKNVEIYSIGNCDHPVCHECSTRMRVLCQQNECPICRQEMLKVVFVRNVRPFSEIQNISNLQDRKYKIFFQDNDMQEEYNRLLEHACQLCPNKPAFKKFQNLKDHIRREHELHYCDLCSSNLKIFTSERRCYTRTDLARHRRTGDLDNRSHRGHPLCEFCDVRYMDNDELFRHLRRDHLFCHFCDADGHHLYYSSYDDLLDHFRNEHYLCEEGACIEEKFTPVFRTEIDLKAHKAHVHGRTLGKAAAKQARTLELEFTLKPRLRAFDGNKRGKARAQNDRDFREEEGSSQDEVSDVQYQTPNLNINDFPSLCGNNSSSTNTTPLTNIQPSSGQRTGGLRIHAVGRRSAQLAVTDENFPALGLPSDNQAQSTSVRLNINSDRSSGKVRTSANLAPTNLSIHVNRRPISNDGSRLKRDDFPALSSNSEDAPGSSKWVAAPTKKKPTPPPAPAVNKPFKTEEDFPSLNPKPSSNLNLKSNEPVKSNFVSLKSNKNSNKPTKSNSVLISVNESAVSPLEVSESSVKKSKKKKTKSTEERTDTAKKKTEDLEEKKLNKTESKKVKTKKRSELNIANLNNDSEPTASEKKEDKAESQDWFDCVGNFNSFKKETRFQQLSLSDSPPHSTPTLDTEMFSSKSKSKPPPGFSNIPADVIVNNISSASGAKPPPGFSVQLNSVARPQSNGLTFTNSSGQSYVIPPRNTHYNYIQPNDSVERNQNLVTMVNQILLDTVNLNEFRTKSSSFRNGTISAEEYFNHCMKSMGEGGFNEVFPELLVLLPDIQKQQELYKLYNEKNIKNNFKGKRRLDTCKTCHQVLTSSDLKLHMVAHHFPSLN